MIIICLETGREVLAINDQDYSDSSASPTEKNDLRLLIKFDFQSQLSSLKRIECPNFYQMVQNNAEFSQNINECIKYICNLRQTKTLTFNLNYHL